MPRPPSPRLRTLGLALLACAAASACGASLGALYESDVRFEHCLALDFRKDVKPTLRRACWREWIKFYTFGQTRDRVEYARMRDRQLSRASNFVDEADFAAKAAKNDQTAAAEPTSALAPPPRVMAKDAGAPEESAPERARDGGPPNLIPADAGPPDPACMADCESGWTTCKKSCKDEPCRNACTLSYGACVQACR